MNIQYIVLQFIDFISFIDNTTNFFSFVQKSSGLREFESAQKFLKNLKFKNKEHREQFSRVPAGVRTCRMAPHRQPKIRPQLRTAIAHQAHPSGAGRSHGYSHDFRLAALETLDRHQGSRLPRALQQQRLWPSKRTLRRWVHRRQTHGHARRYRRTGNRRAQVLVGNHLINLALFRVLWPRGTHHEANIWLHHANGGIRFYQPSQISKAEDALGLSIKRASTTARQALHPINQQLRFNYWNLPAPFGIANVPRERLLDTDEAALFVESSNRGRGKTHLIRRCREVGPYGHSEKTNILLCISGETANPGNPAGRWVSTWNDGGTTRDRFTAFIQQILNDIGPGTPQNWRCFTLDNLNTHHNILIQQMIHAAGHRCIFRAPYYPVDSAIELLFNTVQGALMLKMYELETSQQVRTTFLGLLRMIPDFVAYFEHVGIR
jgi:hypothetical protein